MVENVHINGKVILWKPPDGRVSGYVVVYYKEGEESRNDEDTTEPYFDLTKIPDGKYFIEVE